MIASSIPHDTAILAAPLITAFNPPQSPPLVMTPSLFMRRAPFIFDHSIAGAEHGEKVPVWQRKKGCIWRQNLLFPFRFHLDHLPPQIGLYVRKQKCLKFYTASILLTSVLFLACTQKEENKLAEQAHQKIFKFSTNGSPTTLDPVQSSTHYSSEVVTSIYDQLYEYHYLARPFELKPKLAQALPDVSADKKTYTIKIKHGIFFTDDPGFPEGKGREVTAEDFVYSLKRHFDPKTTSEGAYLWQDKIVGMGAWKDAGSNYDRPVEGLSALERYTIRIRLTKPFPQLIYTLAMGFASIVPKEIVVHYGREFGIHAVGSGPFKLVSFNTQKAVLTRNVGYREEFMDLEGYVESEHGSYGLKSLAGKKIPMVDLVEVHFMEEASSRWNSLTKGGEIQFGRIHIEQQDLAVESVTPLKLKAPYAEKFYVKLQSFFGNEYMAFNMDDPRIGHSPIPEQNEKNKALRCALRKSYDWNIKKREFFHGLADITPGIIPIGLDGYDPNLSRDSVTADPEAAKILLAKVGWKEKDFPMIEIHTIGTVRDSQYFEILRGAFVRIGIPKNKVRYVTYATFGDFNKAMRERKGMVMPQGWGMDYPDAENILALFYGPNASPGSNAANYNNPEYNRLFEQAAVMLPSPERSEIYRRLNQMIIDDCPMIGSFGPQVLYLWEKNVTLYYENYVLGSQFKYVNVR
jgi:ABC-type transport system substrate-binding protein